MNITDKQMLADMENIIEACKERRCEECIMRPSGKAYCAVTDATPQNWEIPATMSEPEPAAAQSRLYIPYSIERRYLTAASCTL